MYSSQCTFLLIFKREEVGMVSVKPLIIYVMIECKRKALKNISKAA